MILVTGDSGFIGTYLTKEFLLKGHSIFGIDINPNKKYEVQYQFIVGDICDESSFSMIPHDIDCIIHLAAAHKDFGVSKEEYYRVNVDGMYSLLRFANKRSIKKIIFFSTVAVYGDNQPSNEETPPHPINYYGSSKLEAEKLLKNWAESNSLNEAVVLRPSVVFGPMNVANIFKLIKQVCDGKFFWIGDGRNIKSVAYVENVVDATRFLFDNMSHGFMVFNYSDEPHQETRELVALIARIANRKVLGFHFPLSIAVYFAKIFDMIGKITLYDFPITSARLIKFNTSTEHRSNKIREMGFHPSHSIEEGIQRNVQWYFDNYKKSVNYIESSNE